MSEVTNPPVAPSSPRTERERMYAARIAYLEGQIRQLVEGIEELSQTVRSDVVAVKAAITSISSLVIAQLERQQHGGEVH